MPGTPHKGDLRPLLLHVLPPSHHIKGFQQGFGYVIWELDEGSQMKLSKNIFQYGSANIFQGKTYPVRICAHITYICPQVAGPTRVGKMLLVAHEFVDDCLTPVIPTSACMMDSEKNIEQKTSSGTSSSQSLHSNC